MTLWSLETYGYIGSKTKSYQILRRFLLLFIFHAFWPYKAGLPCFLTLWPYKAGLPCFLALWPYKAGLLCFLICFPFCWELLCLCPRADRVPTILWIITECLAIHLAASDFSRNDRINYPTRSCVESYEDVDIPQCRTYCIQQAVQLVISELGVWSKKDPRLAYSHLKTNCSIIVGGSGGGGGEMSLNKIW